jgi:chemotaxis protein MotA
MLALIGIVLVFVAVFGGFLLEHGNPYVLMQPAEILIIVGAGIGILLVANPASVIGETVRGALAAFRAPKFTRARFLENLRMLFEILSFTRRFGMVELEKELEDPSGGRIFSNYPDFLKDTPTSEFVCDSLRMMVIGATTPAELDRLMDLDIDVQRRDRRQPVFALSTVADSLPGLGIVAAVLGVVITMEAIGGSASSVGQKVAAALVGTFLGVLLCYGVVGPLAARLEHVNDAESQYLEVLRAGIISFANGASPILAIEYARRSVPTALRPSFLEMEASVRRDARVPAPPVPPQMQMQPGRAEQDAPAQAEG